MRPVHRLIRRLPAGVQFVHDSVRQSVAHLARVHLKPGRQVRSAVRDSDEVTVPHLPEVGHVEGRAAKRAARLEPEDEVAAAAGPTHRCVATECHHHAFIGCVNHQSRHRL